MSRWCDALFALALVAVPCPALATGHAIVVGIDVYQNVQHLRGSVNDAQDIVRALTADGITDVKLLTDTDASRAGFENAWAGAVSRASPGDVLFLTFSGHGIRVPENRLHTTPDGFEKGFLLQPYDAHKASDEILRDEDLYDRFALATAKGLKVIFVADACHSGATVRGIDPRGGKGTLRLQHFDTTSAPLSQAVADAPVVNRPPNPNVTIFSATDEHLTIQEIVIDNAYRGALSYAFSRGISTSDASDGAVTAASLKTFIAPLVRTLSGNRQIPQFAIPVPELVVAEVAATTGHGTVGQLPRLNVSVVPESAVPTVVPDGVTFVSQDAVAELQWDAARYQLIDSNGDLIASDIDATRLSAALETQRVMDSLRSYMARQAVSLTASVTGEANPDATHYFVEGDKAEFSLDPGDFTYVIMLDLNAHGTVQLMWPAVSLGEPADGSAPTALRFTAPVTAPFGADHVVSIASREPLDDLVGVISGLHNRIAPLDLYQAFTRAAAKSELRIGINSFYSCEAVGDNEQCK